MNPTEEMSADFPKASIIIACKVIDNYVEECIRESQKLDYPNYEIIILPDYADEFAEESVTSIPTGPIPPSEKRNIGAKHAKGQVLGFIDGDAYPARDWLRNAVKYLKDPDVSAVGGPGLTPVGDGVRQQASGEILASFAGAGSLNFRNSRRGAQKCDDLPSVNLLVRRESFESVGGFDSAYWPGEDTKFCRELGLKGGKLLYAPDVQVFHHRKPLFEDHLRQVARYGLHRGYFSKRYPENSRKLAYFGPSILVLALPIGTLLLFSNGIGRTLALLLGTAYLTVLVVGAGLVAARRRNLELGILVFLGSLTTHLCYGVFFLKGVFSKKIPVRTSFYKSNIERFGQEAVSSRLTK